jgi:glycosyltransferase involved in cell wall biosynthesis
VSDARLGLAIIDPTMTPYRLHFHRRILAECPDVRLWSVRLHDHDLLPWTLDLPRQLEAVSFDAPMRPGRVTGALADVAKGRRVVKWLATQPVQAVVLGGYGDLARLEIIAGCARSGLPCFLFGDSNARADTRRGPRRWIKAAALPMVLRRCAGVLACGSLGREYFRRYGVADDRVFLAPYEPDYAALQAVTAADGAALCVREGLDPGRRRLVFSGRLAPEKRVDLLIDAFAALAPERTAWDLVLVGQGPLDASLRGRIPAVVRDRVRFAGFVDGRRELSTWYRACDVLVVPSDFEPWGVVVNEGLAAGLALVCSDVVGAAADLVRDGINGRLFRSGSQADLLEALRDVTRPERLARMRAAAPGVLADWRRVADPVLGLRAALRSAALLSG